MSTEKMDDQQRARELLSNRPLASILRAMALNYSDSHAWDHLDTETCNQAATALDGLIEQHARDSQELRRLCQSRDFYQRRCDALQAVQSSMRDPERKAVCDILANGETYVYPSARPQGVKDAS